MTDLGPGTLLDGKYEILSRLGVGGMGEVFKARHVHLDVFRCIKVMKQSLLADDAFRSRFLREAQLATQIHHPNIAVVHDFFLGDRGSYMVSEFIDGTTVRQWSKANGRFPLGLAADVAVQVLAGLDYIHRRGLLHRDISSDNVMLMYDRDDRLVVKIIDLGIAKDINTVSADTTQVGVMIGNPKYMSPEQLGDIAPGEQIDRRADLYCLGIVLYEMLIGTPPFVSETPHGYIIKHLTERPPSFQSVKPEVDWPAGLETVIQRALEKNRRNRFPDAHEFSEALLPFLGAPAGTLTRDEVSGLRRGPENTIVQPLPPPKRRPVDLPTVAIAPESESQRDWKKTLARDTIDAYKDFIAKHPDAPDTTEAKARVFELSLLETVRQKEKELDRKALQRLAEAHPPGTLVGNAAREALGRVGSVREGERVEEEAFQKAWEAGTSNALRQFVDAYPKSKQLDRAKELLREALAFEKASGAPTDTGLREFLKVWPEGRHHLEAEIRLVNVKQRLGDAAFEQAKAADTYNAFRDFLARFPATTHAEDAQRALEERLAFETAAVADSEDAWEDYLRRFGNDRHAEDARARCDRIRAREDEAWRAATEQKSAAGWESFIANHPDSRRIARAERNRREALAYDKAKGGGRAALDDFLRVYADGVMAKEARRIVRQLADDDDFAQAEALGTARAWSLYLTTHPSGAHAGEARDRLSAIEDAAFAAVMASKNPDNAAQFVADYPQSPRREQVSRMATKWNETAAVQKALDAIGRGDAAEASALLAKIVDVERRSEIESALDGLHDRQSWEEASRVGTVAALRGYLESRPKGHWASDARRQLAKAEAAVSATEPRDFDTAWEAGTVTAWDTYLAAHAQSPRVAEARKCRQEAVDFALAVQTNTLNMWRAFVKTWPDGRHRLDADVRLRAKK
jgi:serine/threonine protein kinase